MHTFIYNLMSSTTWLRLRSQLFSIGVDFLIDQLKKSFNRAISDRNKICDKDIFF